MTTVLMNVHDKLAMCNSIVHISVQLLSPPALASKMVRHYHLLHIIICSFRHLVNSLLVDVTGQSLTHLQCYQVHLYDMFDLTTAKDVLLGNAKLL